MLVTETQDPGKICSVCGRRADSPCVGIANVQTGTGCIAQIHDASSSSYGIRHARIMAAKGDHTYTRPTGE